MPGPTRRSVLLAPFALLREPTPRTRLRYRGINIERLTVRSAALGGRFPVEVMVPPGYADSGMAYPSLYLLGGATEAAKGPNVSVRYWADFVQLQRMLDELWSGAMEKPLERHFAPSDAAEWRAALAKGPVPHFITVCPHTPSSMPTPAFRTYMMDELPAAIARHYRIFESPSRRGLDGACLGGAQALMLAATRPGHHGSLGSLQTPANLYEARLLDALDRFKGAKLRLNLTTSDKDVYRRAVLKYAKAAVDRGLTPRVRVLRGPHGFPFYRAAGGYDLVLFHGVNFRDVV